MPKTAEKRGISKGPGIVDEAFIRNRTANFHLSVQAGNDGLSYGVFDIKNNRFIALETFSFRGIYNPAALASAIKELTSVNEVLNNIFKSVQVGIIHERSTLIPNALFEKGHEKAYLAFNHFIDSNDEIMVYDLKAVEAKNIFSVPAEIAHVFRKTFPNARFNHHSSPLIESLVTRHRNDRENFFFIHVQASHFEAVVLKGKELLFYNSFRYQSSEDFIYYVLYVYDQLKLNPESVELTLLGEVERNSALYSIIYSYVRNVKFGLRNEQYSYSHGFTNLPGHFHYSLLNQYLCA